MTRTFAAVAARVPARAGQARAGAVKAKKPLLV
jgi:hypothetical protein